MLIIWKIFQMTMIWIFLEKVMNSTENRRMKMHHRIKLWFGINQNNQNNKKTNIDLRIFEIVCEIKINMFYEKWINFCKEPKKCPSHL